AGQWRGGGLVVGAVDDADVVSFVHDAAGFVGSGEGAADSEVDVEDDEEDEGDGDDDDGEGECEDGDRDEDAEGDELGDRAAGSDGALCVHGVIVGSGVCVLSGYEKTPGTCAR